MDVPAAVVYTRIG